MLIKNKVEVLAKVISGGGTQLTNIKGQSIDFSKIVVEFMTTEGNKVIAYENVSKNQLQNYSIGQEIKIIYSKTNPQNIDLLAYSSDIKEYIGSEERRIEINDLLRLFNTKEDKILNILNGISHGWEYNSYKQIWSNESRNIAITLNSNNIKCISEDFFTFPKQLKELGYEEIPNNLNENEIAKEFSNKIFKNDSLTISIEKIKSSNSDNRLFTLTTIINKHTQ